MSGTILTRPAAAVVALLGVAFAVGGVFGFRSGWGTLAGSPIVGGIILVVSGLAILAGIVITLIGAVLFADAK
jgi:hypothetical protein